MELSCYLTVCIPLIKSSCGLTRGVLWFCGSTSSPQCLCPAHIVFFVSIANEKRAFLLLFEFFFSSLPVFLGLFVFFSGFFFTTSHQNLHVFALTVVQPRPIFTWGAKKKKKDEWSDSSFHRTHHTTFFLPPCCVTLRRDSCTKVVKQRRKKWW